MVKPWLVGVVEPVLGTECSWFLVRDLPERGVLVGSSQVAAGLAELLVTKQLAACCSPLSPPQLPDCSGSASFSTSGEDEGANQDYSAVFGRCDKISVTPTAVTSGYC
jgi:hypothetical protein